MIQMTNESGMRSGTGFKSLDRFPRNYAAFFLAAHLAFIIAESFFRIAGLIGFRPEAFFWAGAAFLAPPLPFCFAHQAFLAAAILARAAALI